jgi:glutamine amidotransferase
MDVVVVRTGTANIASVMAGLRRAGATPRVSEDPADVSEAGWVVLPGVGTLGAAMERIGELGLGEALGDRILAGRPTMCVCLGLQMLCEGSDESPGVGGLGIVAARVTRFGSGVRVPQLGWNAVTAARSPTTAGGSSPPWRGGRCSRASSTLSCPARGGSH